MVRFFCLVAPGSIGDAGYAYLMAIAACAKVRALPIGPAAALGFDHRWARAGHLFTVPLELPYVNIVCAPIGMPLGVRAPVSTLGTKTDLPGDLPPALRKILERDADKVAADPDPIVYEPQTAFSGLYTVGCTNIAIVKLDGAKPDGHELAALAKYHRVLCSTLEDYEHLEAQDVNVMLCAPEHLNPTFLKLLCGENLEIVHRDIKPANVRQELEPTTTARAPGFSLWPLSGIGRWISRIWRSAARRLRRR